MGKRSRELAEMRQEMELLRAQVAAQAEAAPPTPVPREGLDARGLGGQRADRFTRRTFRHRKHLAPLALMGGLHAAAAAAHATSAAPPVVAGAAAGAGLVWWGLRGRRRLDRAPERLYGATVWAAGTAWATAATGIGVTAVDSALWTTGAALAVPWWVHHRVRPRRPEPEAPALGWVEEIREVWAARVACPQGPLPGSRLLDVRESPGGWRATIELEDGTSDTAQARVKDIGARLKLRADQLSIEPHPHGLHLAVILVQPDNPLATVRHWEGPTLDVHTGVSQIGIYADLEPVRYRHWRRGHGPVHTLIAGTTDAGKSALVKMLLAEERHSGLVLSWLIDPQRGQSYSGWKKSVHRFAGTLPEARKLLFQARARMYARNELLSNLEWTDERGRLIEGVEDFTPGDPRHGLPLLAITIDEAQVILSDDICCALVEEIIAMSRKCGIKIRLLTQVPLQGSLGDSQQIKDAVASGNVVVLRTANPLSGGAAFNGAMPVDPVMLPKEWPDGTSTSGLGFVFAPGADRPTTMRTLLPVDAYGWSQSGEPAVADDVVGEVPELDEDGRPIPPPIEETSPATAAAGEAHAAAKPRARDRVLALFADGRSRTAIEVKQHFYSLPEAEQIAGRTVVLALQQLTEAGLLNHQERGPYQISDAGREAVAPRLAAV
ncbi:hypothetical protein [Actinomadura sp. WMMA1423]|uniref:hypothetical protein n=1 Tax=Actinomadura sp. WMMA1423 TaxID=2591108 RepID=UPI0011472EC5|nr:hypothetical protein [Actinomadura sp. WMMA1423]